MVEIGYASRHFHIPRGYLGRDKLILIGAEPARPRGMGLFVQEDGSWLLTLVGYGPEHRPPTEDAGYWSSLPVWLPLTCSRESWQARPSTTWRPKPSQPVAGVGRTAPEVPARTALDRGCDQ